MNKSDLLKRAELRLKQISDEFNDYQKVAEFSGKEMSLSHLMSKSAMSSKKRYGSYVDFLANPQLHKRKLLDYRDEMILLEQELSKFYSLNVFGRKSQHYFRVGMDCDKLGSNIFSHVTKHYL